MFFSAGFRVSVGGKRRSPEILSSGFTLLELLLAITILAFIIGTLYGTFWGTTSNTRRIRETVKIYHVGRLLLSQLLSDLESTYFDKSLKGRGGEESKAAFKGEEITGDRGRERVDRLSFFTASQSILDAEKDRSLIWYVSYYLEQNEDTGDYSLIRRAVPMVESTDLLEKDQKEGLSAYDFVLSRHVKSFRIEYINPDGEKSESWDSNAGSAPIPSAVRISVTLNNPEGEPVTLGTEVFIPVSTVKE